MDQRIIFPDARLAIRDRLRVLLAARTEAYAKGVTVSTRDLPYDASPTVPVPYIQVRIDNAGRDSQLDGRATVRVLCYGADDGKTTSLALLAEALILADRDAEELRGCVSEQSTTPTSDPDSGLPMAVFTFSARLRPSNL